MSIIGMWRRAINRINERKLATVPVTPITPVVAEIPVPVPGVAEFTIVTELTYPQHIDWKAVDKIVDDSYDVWVHENKMEAEQKAEVSNVRALVIPITSRLKLRQLQEKHLQVVNEK